MEREVMTWADLGAGARALAEQVHADGFRPELLLAIARGGHFLAGALGYALDVKSTFTLNVEYYTGVDERLARPVLLPPVPDPDDLSRSRVLVVDDVADTGETLQLVLDWCAGHVAEARVAVLYQKPRSSVRCDYVWRRTDRWITFPWSAEPPVGATAEAAALHAG